MFIYFTFPLYFLIGHVKDLVFNLESSKILNWGVPVPGMFLDINDISLSHSISHGSIGQRRSGQETRCL